jgi:hypothetical protein
MPFLTPLQTEKIGEKAGRGVWRVLSPLIYQADGLTVVVPEGFETDFASVPRVPLAYLACGDEAHEAATVHDYLYCSDCTPNVDRETADGMFLKAMEDKGESWWRRKVMYRMVRMFAASSFHKRKVTDPR